jgi:hypothetical protein
MTCKEWLVQKILLFPVIHNITTVKYYILYFSAMHLICFNAKQNYYLSRNNLSKRCENNCSFVHVGHYNLYIVSFIVMH